MKAYLKSNWYWIVAGNSQQVWSSASQNYVSVTDATYVAWLADGGVPTNIGAFNDVLKITIEALEEQQTQRRIREAANGTDSGWLKTLDTKILALRAQLTS